MDYSSNQPGEPMPQQSSYNPPPPPPPPQKKGFNWLACCGISCLVIVVLGALVLWGCYSSFFKPLMAMGQQMDKLGQEVSSTDETVIRAAAIPVSATDFSASPDTYKDTWLEVTGNIISLDAMSNFSGSRYGTADATTYVLEGNILVMDITNTPHVATVDEQITAYGKSFTLDLKDLPLFGAFIEEQAKSDPALQGVTKVTFLMTKDVSKAAPAEESDDGASAEPAEESEGWVR